MHRTRFWATSGTDGTLGLEEIKGSGGMTMVQSEASSRYAGMPHSAISTMQVDYVLPAGELPGSLLAYERRSARRARPLLTPVATPEALARIFMLIRSRTGHDFSGYKRATIGRRIERRMTVHEIEQIGDYVQYLLSNPLEVHALFKELLIGVTSFFRDAPAFEALESALASRLAERVDDHVFRVWVAGCSTGEVVMPIRGTSRLLARRALTTS
jgi:two-component system, chemotaxis family, CheB/CheR fusion protein